MSHNPNTIKSQDDLSTTNDGKRSTNVLLSTIEELEYNKKMLDIAIDTLKVYAEVDNWYNIYKQNRLDETPIAFKQKWKTEKGYKPALDCLKKILKIMQELNK